MNKKWIFIITAVVVALSAAAAPRRPVLAETVPVTVPPDFTLVDNAPGVDLYRKDYTGGTPDFVLVIDLSKGAGVQLLFGSTDGSGSGSGAYGGDNPAFSRQSLQQFWDSFAAANSDAVCVVNGGSFDPNTDPAAGLALKAGQLVSAVPACVYATKTCRAVADHARIST